MGLVRNVCRNMSIAALAMLLMLAVPSAQANPWYGHSARDGGYQNQRGDRQNDAQRQSLQRDERAQNQRQQRMSPEERQQLRRDIRDAGRNIYPPRR